MIYYLNTFNPDDRIKEELNILFEIVLLTLHRFKQRKFLFTLINIMFGISIFLSIEISIFYLNNFYQDN